MRQRKIKDVENKILQYEHFLVRDSFRLPGYWREHLRSAEDSAECNLFVEVGSGKGRFLIDRSAGDLENFYVGFEGQASAIYRALCKADEREAQPRNFRFCHEYIYDIREHFCEAEVSGIYLNFSDPWPKSRQEKRRLTSPTYLDGYLHVLDNGGFLEFKTDNDALFSYSVEQFRACQGFRLTAVTDDLHRSEYAEGNTETEYEHKFRNLKRRIHFLRAEKACRP